MAKATLDLLPDEAAATPPSFPKAPMMETATCLVRLNGDAMNEVYRTGVTAPEIVVLRRIHNGNDAVYNVVKDGEKPVGAVSERIRLLKTYPRYGELIDKLFPGLAPQFPRTIAEVEALVEMEQERQEIEARGELAPQATPLD